ncbi:hypothetical protein T4A_6126, partial [Trichinella pseudospiralis]
LLRAGSSVSSARLLARPSLFVDGPVLAASCPLLSASRFNDGLATTEQQQWVYTLLSNPRHRPTTISHDRSSLSLTGLTPCSTSTIVQRI